MSAVNDSGKVVPPVTIDCRNTKTILKKEACHGVVYGAANNDYWPSPRNRDQNYPNQ